MKKTKTQKQKKKSTAFPSARNQKYTFTHTFYTLNVVAVVVDLKVFLCTYIYVVLNSPKDPPLRMTRSAIPLDGYRSSTMLVNFNSANLSNMGIYISIASSTTANGDCIRSNIKLNWVQHIRRSRRRVRAAR